MSQPARRFSVTHWGDLEILQAASMDVGRCTDTHLPMIGVDMHAQDGATFAHGHFDIETAKLFHQALGKAIDEAMS